MTCPECCMMVVGSRGWSLQGHQLVPIDFGAVEWMADFDQTVDLSGRTVRCLLTG